MRRKNTYDLSFIKEVYNDFIENENEINRQNRYVGKERYFSASTSGGCVRKKIFKTLGYDETNKKDKKTNRVLRFGTTFHSELEDALNMFLQSGKSEEYGIKKLHMEKEIVLEEINLRGFYDLVIETLDDEIIVMDFKTIKSFPWKLRVVNDGENHMHELQLGIYAYAVAKEFGRVDEMVLAYYNKDTSEMRGLKVDTENMNKAYQYWKKVCEMTNYGAILPKMEVGVSPNQEWECSYCEFHDVCIENHLMDK